MLDSSFLIGVYSSIAFSIKGMEKEIENLITENNELLATKNALNIVKDDLIAKVDELQSELTMCANEIQQRDAVKERLKSRIASIEEELKKCKEENEDLKQKLAAPKEVIKNLIVHLFSNTRPHSL